MASRMTEKQREKRNLADYYYRLAQLQDLAHGGESAVEREKRLRKNELARARRAQKKAEEARQSRKIAAHLAAAYSDSESDDSDDY